MSNSNNDSYDDYYAADVTIGATDSSKRRKRQAGGKKRVNHEKAAVKISGMHSLSTVEDMAFLQAAEGEDYSYAMGNLR